MKMEGTAKIALPLPDLTVVVILKHHSVLFEQTFSCRFLVKITTYQRGDKVAMVIGHHPNLLRLLENVSDPFRRAIEHNM